MTDAVTVEWLLVSPSAEDKRALSDWARARGVMLEESLNDDQHPLIDEDPAIATQVEHDLQLARDATAKLDLQSAETALARAETLLRDHPEIPQASWLLAEVYRGWSARWSRLSPIDLERAETAWSQAAALDGGRSAGVGERAFETKPTLVSYVLTIDGADDIDVRWDGRSIAAGPQNGSEGVHQLMLERRGGVRFATWATVGEGTNIRLSLPSARACSQDDLKSAHMTNGHVVTNETRCGAWIAVVKDGAKISIARCEKNRCGDFLIWDPAPARRKNPVLPKSSRWPQWATWTLVTAGVLTGVGITLGALGVFTPSSTATRFVEGGLKPESLR